MWMPIWWHITVAFFAVVGFSLALRACLACLYLPENLTVAIEIRTREDADMLDMLLHEAGSAFSRPRAARTVVLISTALMDGTVGFGEELLEHYENLLDRYGAECYLIQPNEGEI